MKKGKLLVAFLSLVLFLGFTTGCDKKEVLKDNETKTKAEEKDKLKANCSALECIKKIEPTNTVEEVNKIVGVDGVLTDEKYNIYEYDLGNDEKITLKYYSGKKATIVADYEEDDLADKKVDLSKLQDLKAKVSSGISYDDFKKEIGNVDGTLVEKSDISNKYVWVSKKGGSVKATFRTSDNLCSFFSGFGDTK